MTADLASRIAGLLDAYSVMSLATIGADGPHAASLFYARDDFTLIWVSEPASRHSRHIAERAAVAATIAAADHCDFAQVKGLQLRGRARRIVGAAERAQARQQLQARYPFLQRLSAGDVREAYDRAEFYRLEPEHITLIDNTRGFGSKEVLVCPVAFN